MRLTLLSVVATVVCHFDRLEIHVDFAVNAHIARYRQYGRRKAAASAMAMVVLLRECSCIIKSPSNFKRRPSATPAD